MARVGQRYECKQRPAWSDGNGPADPPRGYYPVKRSGQVDWKTRLRWVDDAPDDPADGAGHFEVMPRSAGTGYFHATCRGDQVPEGTVVPLEAQARGRAKAGGTLARAVARIRYILGPRR